MKKQEGWFNAIKILLFILLLGCLAVIGLYKFPNRNLNLRVHTENTGDIEIYLDNATIAAGEISTITLQNVKEGTVINGITVYGKSKTLRLKDIKINTFWQYLDNAGDEGAVYKDNSVAIEGSGDIELSVKPYFNKDMKMISSSFVQERIILAGWITCVFLLIYIVIVAIKDWKSPDNWNNHSPFYEFKKFIKDFKKYRQYMFYAAKTDLRAEVANSYLNRLWWLLEPFFSMLVYVIVFGNIMGKSIENYATFVFSALLMWSLFSKTINYSVKVVRSHRDIVSKVYVPKFVLLISDMILNMTKFGFSMIVLIPMLIIFKIKVGWAALMSIPALLILLVFSFGVGMICLHYGVYIDDLGYAVGILTNMLMFLSGIFYDCTTGLPEPFSYLIPTLNPMAMCIDTMRQGLLYNTVVNLPQIAVWSVASILLCFIGVHIVYKNENSYVKLV